jgi:hypothetical protein
MYCTMCGSKKHEKETCYRNGPIEAKYPSQTLFELLKDDLKDRPVWAYQVYGPLSFDDYAEVEVMVSFGEKREVSRETYKFMLARIRR